MAFFNIFIDLLNMTLVKSDKEISHYYDVMLSDQLQQYGDYLRHKLMLIYQVNNDLQSLTQKDKEISDLAIIEYRRPYIDPLNLVQAHVLQKMHLINEDSTDYHRYEDALMLSIAGIAAGMKKYRLNLFASYDFNGKIRHHVLLIGLMSMKKILLCVTGSIAVYKAVELVRLLVKANCQVKVVMSKHAGEFIQPLTFETVSLNKVYTDLFKHTEHPIEHIELARWADEILIAPASAHSIAKATYGLADDLIGNILLATNKPITLAPAMNKYMWQNTIVQENVTRLMNHGIKILAPPAGEQACGDLGEGRLMEPQSIVAAILQANSTQQMTHKRVMITAGPTVEKIDPVRYISNHSSGKMGYALAKSFVNQGWQVTLILGPTQLTPPDDVKVIKVESAQQMYDAVHDNIVGIDVFIAAAAVADYRCEKVAEQKIKKQNTQKTISLSLIKNKDILASVANKTSNRPFCVGFAAETNDSAEQAIQKLHHKKLDLIILNQVEPSGFPFYSDYNSICVYNDKEDTLLQSKHQSKSKIAKDLAILIQQQASKKEIKEQENG